MSEHALYRFFGSDDALLYVGITLDPGRRFKQHREAKPWWSDVKNITIEVYPDRESVLEAERRAIERERPKHNVVFNGGHSLSRVRRNGKRDDWRQIRGLIGTMSLRDKKRMLELHWSEDSPGRWSRKPWRVSHLRTDQAMQIELAWQMHATSFMYGQHRPQDCAWCGSYAALKEVS